MRSASGCGQRQLRAYLPIHAPKPWLDRTKSAASTEPKLALMNLSVGIFHQVWAVAEISDRQCIEETLADVRLAEELGFASFGFGEHHSGREKAYFGRVPIPEYLIARLAAETTRIQLGTAVKVLPLDTAARCAEGIALLDILTDGRAIFGLGMGVRADPLAATHDRGELFRAQLRDLRNYLRGDVDPRQPRLTPA